MLLFYIKELLEKLGRKPSALLLSKFNINYRTATELIEGRAKSIKLDTLFKLCEMLQCTPNDLLTITPQTASQLAPKHPLLGLQKANFSETPLDMMRTFSPADLDNIVQLIKTYKQEKER